MQCPGCGQANRESASFCGGCGQSLAREVACTRCAAVNPPGQRFCDACGAPLAASPGQAAPTTGGRASGAPTASALPASGGASATRSVSGASRRPAAPAPGAPTSFAGGRYAVRGFLGEGAKKRVYLAHDARLNREVAIALIKGDALDAGGRERVRREAEAMGQLGDHPHAVTVYDVAEEGGQLFIVSQYMAGGDLEAHLHESEGRRLAVPEALRIADQVAQALEHAHGRSVIHRDVKPGNVWLAADGAACLGDFGLALALGQSRLTQDGMMVGTAAYMAPEQALGRAPDVRSDLYALGATLYEMVAGRPPFVGDDPVAVISQHINTPPVAPSWHNPQVSRPLEALILDLLAKDPGARPPSAGAVRERLAALAGAAVSVTAAVAREAANPLDRLASGVFVGREVELAKLRGGLDAALAGRGRILLLVGEPGVGKTRTSEELVTYARMRGAQVLWGRCYEGEGAPPYWPWVQVIRSYAHECEPRTLAAEMGPGASDIAAVVSEVRARLPGLPEPPPLEPDQARFRLFDGVAGFLRNAARRQPLVLVLDDLHWADKASLLLLQFLARELGSDRLLVLGTYRDVELRRQHPLSETLAELARNPLCERVLLRGLARADVARFIEATTGKAPAEALADAVFRETEGNPFFVHEVVRLLAADGRLERPPVGGSWSLEIPQGVREVVGRRLNRLSEECNQALAIASVVGREFDLAVLQRVAELPEERLLETLEEAAAARVIGDVPEARGRYRFSHALVRETLYEELNTPRRVRLHARVGAVLEELHRDEGPQLAEISHHCFQAVQAGGVDRAVEAATRAGDWAAGRLAHEEAALHYERAVQALELGEKPDPARLAVLVVRLAELQRDAGVTERGRETAVRGAALARELGSAELLARAALAYGGNFPVIEMGRMDATMIALAEEALAALGDGDSLLRIEVLCRLATEFFFGGASERIEAILEEAFAAARRLGDPAALARALACVSFGRMCWTAEDWERVRGVHEEVIRLSRETGDAARAHFATAGLVTADLSLGRRDLVDRDIARGAALAREARNPASRYFPVMYRAMTALLEGRFAEGSALAQEALQVGLATVESNALQWFACQHMGARVHLGGYGPTPQLEEWVGRFTGYPLYRVALAHACAAVGDARARELFDGLAREGFALPEDGNWGPGMYLLAHTAELIGDAPGAALLHERLVPCAGVHAQWGAGIAYVGPLSGALARTAVLLGRLDEAERHFADALAGLESLRAWPSLATYQHAFARMLLARAGPGDRARALELLNRALERAQALGMKPLTEQALAAKLEAQGVASGSHDQQRSIDVVAWQVDRRRPDLSATAAPDGTVTLVFSDMEGFTRMTESLGDVAAHQVVQAHNRIVREQTAAHGGREVELRGDGFLLAFPSARQAALCSIALQRAMAAHNAANGGRPIRIRIGIHTGEALRDADKFFGRSVIQAFRIADLAAGAEILTSSLTAELLRSAGDLRFGEEREVELKGLEGRHRVYALDWAGA
jgi:class 3 adenylate cyclase